MALLLNKIFVGYDIFFNVWSDPRTASWTFMGSPFPLFAILGSYLYFVNRLGPRLMSHREPFKLKGIMMVYNVFQIILCLLLLYRGITIAWGTKYKLFCEPVDFSNTEEAIEVASTVYYYLILKIIDLGDTIFFVLRKKQSHVSFLHVYHHTGMVLLIWSAVKFLPGGHGTSLGIINSVVHVVMYTYYLLTLIDKKYQKSIWWKKHITQLQILQFLILVIHYVSLVIIPNCGYPPWVAAFVVPQNLFMLILFIDFYIKTYVKKGKKNESNSIEQKNQNGHSTNRNEIKID